MFDPQLVPVVLNPEMEYTTHLSINSAAAVLQEIRKHEEDHWFAGLRQAELFIHEKRSALTSVYYQLRSQQRRHRQLFREARAHLLRLSEVHQSMALKTLEDLQIVMTLEGLSDEDLDRLEDWGDQIEQLERAVKDSQVLIRDAQMELSVAVSERDRIRAEHAEELEGTTFASLQALYAPVMLHQRQARYLAARIWAAQNGLPETVGAALFDVPVAQREELLRREAAIRTQLDVPAAMTRASLLLASLEPEQQQAVLIQAAQLVIGEGQSNGGTNQGMVDCRFHNRPE